MELNIIKQVLQDAFPDAQVEVKGDGYHHEVVVVSNDFEGQSLVVRQQSIYKLFAEQIQSGELHALTIKAKTPEEWRT